MALRRPSNVRLGLFVVAAAVLILVAIAWLGAARFWKAREVLETYFNESVQGLEIGSPVKYRGVVVGRVTSIGFTQAAYEKEKPLPQRRRYVMVLADIGATLVGSTVTLRQAGDEFFKPLINDGLRVRMANQGLTGTSYLEIDYVDPKANPSLDIDWQPEHFYIPSARSTQTQILSAAGDTLTRLRALDFESTLANTNRVLAVLAEKLDKLDTQDLSTRSSRVLDKLEKKIDEAPVGKLATQLSGLVGELRESNKALQKVLSDPALATAPKDLGVASAKLRQIAESETLERTLAKLEKTMTRLEKVTGASEGDIEETFANLRATTGNLKELTAEIRRRPTLLLWGR